MSNLENTLNGGKRKSGNKPLTFKTDALKSDFNKLVDDLIAKRFNTLGNLIVAGYALINAFMTSGSSVVVEHVLETEKDILQDPVIEQQWESTVNEKNWGDTELNINGGATHQKGKKYRRIAFKKWFSNTLDKIEILYKENHSNENPVPQDNLKHVVLCAKKLKRKTTLLNLSILLNAINNTFSPKKPKQKGGELSDF